MCRILTKSQRPLPPSRSQEEYDLCRRVDAGHCYSDHVARASENRNGLDVMSTCTGNARPFSYASVLLRTLGQLAHLRAMDDCSCTAWPKEATASPLDPGLPCTQLHHARSCICISRTTKIVHYTAQCRSKQPPSSRHIHKRPLPLPAGCPGS